MSFAHEQYSAVIISQLDDLGLLSGGESDPPLATGANTIPGSSGKLLCQQLLIGRLGASPDRWLTFLTMESEFLWIANLFDHDRMKTHAYGKSNNITAAVVTACTCRLGS